MMPQRLFCWPCPDRGVKDIEVLLGLRNRRSSFVPGYYVFPGGRLDPDDCLPGLEDFVYGLDKHRAAEILSDLSPAEKALGIWVAAIRETFEEVGLLIARHDDGTPVALGTPEERRRFDRYRKALNSGELKFIEMLREEKICLSADALHYYSHWITPEPFPLRYDVRFFVALAPAGQSVVCDGVELTRHHWLRPSVALADYREGRIGMVLPQIMTLQELSRFQAVEDVIVSARNRSVQATATKIVRIDGKDVEVMPDGSVFENCPPVYP